MQQLEPQAVDIETVRSLGLHICVSYELLAFTQNALS